VPGRPDARLRHGHAAAVDAADAAGPDGYGRPAPTGPHQLADPPTQLIARVAALALLALTAAAPVAAQGGGEGAWAYRLTDTWSAAPWRLRAGHYAHAADVGAAPDGTLFVLDRQQQAVHVLGPDGAPRSVFRLPPAGDGRAWTAERLDAAPDGTLYVLAESPGGDFRFTSAVERFASDGTRLARFTAGMDYNDIAVGRDDRLYLTRSHPEVPVTPPPRERPPPAKGGVDVFDSRGTRLETLDGRPLFYPTGVDVDLGDGAVYVINRIPSNSTGEPPVPGPTALPSGRRADQAQQQPPAPAAPIPGIVIYGADHAYRRASPFLSAEDVAAGPAGVFVARNVEVFALDDREPLYAGPTGQVRVPFGGSGVFHLAATADGRLAAAMSHCYFQGLLVFADPSARPATPSLAGALDLPALAGPVYPLRLSASDEVALLQGRFTVFDDESPPVNRAWRFADQPQSVQRWSADGQLRSQLGVCSGVATLWFSDVASAWWARDVALDGGAAYTVDPSFVHYRPDDGFPGWSYWPGRLADPDQSPDEAPQNFLSAVSADGGRAAVLDVGAAQVLVLGRDGALETRWPVAAAGSGDALPADLALGEDRVYLADRGRGRVLVRGLDGPELGSWPLHDGPVGIDVGPTGDVFVLGRGGWALRYGPSGDLKAHWPMPDPGAAALDIAVGDDGRVFVAWLKSALSPASIEYPMYDLRAAGVWVFTPEPAATPAVPPPPPGGCLAAPDKTAAPGVIPLGETVEVRLTVRGRCPPVRSPAQVAIVFDTSRSMNTDAAADRAKAGVLALFERLDPGAVEVALVTFADGATLDRPLSRSLGALASRVAALPMWGDTRMAPGIDAARLELTGPRRDPGARPVIAVVTDGEYKDRGNAAQVAVEAARAAGIDLVFLVYPSRAYTLLEASFLGRLIGDPAAVHLDPGPPAIDAIAARVTDERPEAGLFDTVTVRDAVPANMRYVEGSSVPPATFDPAARVLAWTLGRVEAAAGLSLRYRLEPLETGLWPTNVEASADYRDVRGVAGHLVFPVPRVKVWDRSTLTHRAYLPFGPQRACFRTGAPLDVVLALDTSLSMAEPAAAGGTKLDAARAAALAFVDLLHLARDRVAVVGFNAGATRAVGLTGDKSAVARALSGLATAAGTRIDRGLAEARVEIGARGRADAVGVVVLLTDGLQAGPADPVRAEAAALKSAGARVYAIGLGGEIDRDLLRSVATTPDGYFESPAAEDLARIYGDVSARVACDVGKGR